MKISINQDSNKINSNYMEVNLLTASRFSPKNLIYKIQAYFNNYVRVEVTGNLVELELEAKGKRVYLDISKLSFKDEFKNKTLQISEVSAQTWKQIQISEESLYPAYRYLNVEEKEK